MILLSRNTFLGRVKVPAFYKETVGIFTATSLFLLCLTAGNASAQRSYKANSVLNSGFWGKIAIKDAGIYKVDVNLLTALGFNVSGISSNTIRLFSEHDHTL